MADMFKIYALTISNTTAEEAIEEIFDNLFIQTIKTAYLQQSTKYGFKIGKEYSINITDYIPNFMSGITEVEPNFNLNLYVKMKHSSVKFVFNFYQMDLNRSIHPGIEVVSDNSIDIGDINLSEYLYSLE